MRPFFRIKVVGRGNIPSSVSGLLFAGNHRSKADAAIVWLALERDVRFLAAVELYKWPVLKQALQLARCIPVYRYTNGEAGAHDAMNLAVQQAYNRGDDLVIFPEGGIIKEDAARGVIKSGIERMVAVGYPVVPFTLRNARGSFPWRRQVVVTFHPVIWSGERNVKNRLAALFMKV